jgi:hypothetical protein
MIAWNDVKRTATLALVAGLFLAIPLACPLAKLMLPQAERGNANERWTATGGKATPA